MAQEDWAAGGDRRWLAGSVQLVRWPAQPAPTAGGASVVTVNYNTRMLVALLIWSLHQVLDGPVPLHELVVVDNGSTDGSAEMLSDLDDAGLCTLVANRGNRYHGPALNQAFSYLATKAGSGGAAPEWVWVLDSDCVIAKPDALAAALTAANEGRAAVVGEEQWDSWHQRRRLGVHCLLIDPDRVWRDPISAFTDDGDPVFELLGSCERHAVPSVTFPFLAEGYVIHRGRGTLAEVASSGDRSNRFHEWAKDHHGAHFGEVPGAAERYAALVTDFKTSVPHLSADALVQACRRR